MGLVGRVADRVMAINDGKLLAIGSPQEVRDNADVQQGLPGVRPHERGASRYSQHRNLLRSGNGNPVASA